MADNARDSVLASLKGLRDSGKYSDFIIICKGDIHNVHKAVVCSRSGFFERAERFPAGKESAEGKVDLPEDDPKIVGLLIQYIYEGEYEPKLPDGDCTGTGDVKKIVYNGTRHSGYHYEFPHTCADSRCRSHGSPGYVCTHHVCGNYCDHTCVEFICQSCCPGAKVIRALPPANGGAAQLMLHAQMYEVGDKYDVTGLKELAREKFLRACVEYWDDDRFAAAANYAFTTTPEDDRGLRDVVSNIISQHMDLLEKSAVEALLTEFNGLALGLLKARAKDLGWIQKV